MIMSYFYLVFLINLFIELFLLSIFDSFIYWVVFPERFRDVIDAIFSLKMAGKKPAKIRRLRATKYDWSQDCLITGLGKNNNKKQPKKKQQSRNWRLLIILWK